MGEAEKSEINEANAMSVATVDGEGRPNIRMVLLKGWDEAGFVFYSNNESAKGVELAVSLMPPCACIGNRCAARCGCGARSAKSVPKKPMPISLRGPRTARSAPGLRAQSRPMEGRFVFEKEIAKYAAKYAFPKCRARPTGPAFG